MNSKNKNIVTINAGSSSIKFALFTLEEDPVRQLYGTIDRIGDKDSKLTYHDLRNDKKGEHLVGPTPVALFLMDWLADYMDINSISGIGHRIVHGMRHVEPEKVSHELLDELHKISFYDPDHLPLEIEIIEKFRNTYPDLFQLACFDTSFHSGMPRIAKLIPIPRRYDSMGIQRYGFHGISYAYLMEELARAAGIESANGKVILAHLGSGASLAAVQDGKSIETSMGFTPASGLVMGARTGDLDPGVAWFLMQSENMTPDQFNNLINHQSGLLGISETSSDMRDLLKIQANDPRAAEAVELFCYQTKKWIGSFTTVLEGLDTLVFSGGIGENSPEVRSRICNGLQFLGIELDVKRNTENNNIISADKSRVSVRIIKTNEELMIAKSVFALLNNSIKK